jgi:DNA polymerase elongation subunit (family B)
MKVVYGHTDSIYVQIDSVETAKKAIKEIEASVREHFPNIMELDEHPVVLEFEKYFSALGVGTTKNRNAGLVSWEDGEWLKEPKFTMTGFTAKRVSETKLAKGVQTNTLKMWVENKSQKEINMYLFDTYLKVSTGQIDLKSIIKRSRLRPNRFTVKCPECNAKYHLRDCLDLKHSVCKKCATETTKFTTLDGKKPSIGSGIAGVLYAWEKNDTKFDDSYLFIKVKGAFDTFIHPLTQEKKEVEYISGITYEDFKGCSPDWKHYAEQVVKKAEPIYKAMGWDISSIRTGYMQTSLDEWW